MKKLITLLTGHHITAVADVRSYPYSRFNPQFNQDSLHSALKTEGISYVFLGRELGGRPEDRTCYLNGSVQYDRLASTDLFQKGLQRIVEGAKKHQIVLLCAEKDPLTCHRTILVCRHLVTRGITVQHILEDGSIESHDEALLRLLKELDLPQGDLVQSRDDFIIEAYKRRSQQIAYTEKNCSPNEPLREL
jgi:uncharacterized protein (DUF488 family)